MQLLCAGMTASELGREGEMAFKFQTFLLIFLNALVNSKKIC